MALRRLLLSRLSARGRRHSRARARRLGAAPLFAGFHSAPLMLDDEMFLTSQGLPSTIDNVAALDEFLARPAKPLVADLAALDGDILILGVGGKMGPTL